MEAGLGRRRARPAEHGDRFFPWSKGGSPTLQNFVTACARCNRTKGARIPSLNRLGELVRDNRLTLTRDSEQIHGTARNAVGTVAHHLDATPQVAVLETSD